MYSLVSAFVCSAVCLQDISIWLHIYAICSFSLLCNIPFHHSSTISCCWWTLGLFPAFDPYEYSFCENFCTCLLLDTNSHFCSQALRCRLLGDSHTSCPYTCIVSLIINISHQKGSLFTKDEPLLIHHNHPKSIVCLRIHSGYRTFYRFGQCIMSKTY